MGFGYHFHFTDNRRDVPATIYVTCPTIGFRMIDVVFNKKNKIKINVEIFKKSTY